VWAEPRAHLCGLFVPGESFEGERASNHVPAETRGCIAIVDLHGTVDRETAMTPSQKVADDLLADETLVHEHPQHLGAEEAFEVAGVEAWQVAEAPIGAEAAIGRKDVDMGMEELPLTLP
jgi:hypothetical protein